MKYENNALCCFHRGQWWDHSAGRTGWSSASSHTLPQRWTSAGFPVMSRDRPTATWTAGPSTLVSERQRFVLSVCCVCLYCIVLCVWPLWEPCVLPHGQLELPLRKAKICAVCLCVFLYVCCLSVYVRWLPSPAA